MAIDYHLYYFPKDSEVVMEDYLNARPQFDKLVKELYTSLSMTITESFTEFILNQHNLYRETMRLVVVKENTVPIGFICYSVRDRVFVSFLIVSESYRRQGIGQGLIDALFIDCPKCDVYLLCPTRQDTATQFYLRHGFRTLPQKVMSDAQWLVNRRHNEVSDDIPRKRDVGPKGHWVDQ